MYSYLFYLGESEGNHLGWNLNMHLFFCGVSGRYCLGVGYTRELGMIKMCMRKGALPIH